MAYSEILPNPSNKISSTGAQDNVNGEGPGYASVQVTGKFPVYRDQTNSGTHIARSAGTSTWEVSIEYNPMTRAEFAPIYAFLLEKQGGLKPFYVPLPQYNTFTTTLTAASGATTGATSIVIDATTSYPSPGDMFTFDEPSNHTKAYKVTRVDSTTGTGNTPPTSGQARLSFAPALRKTVTGNASLIFNAPKIKVIQKDIIQYSLGTNNLYSFSLQLEEVQ